MAYSQPPDVAAGDAAEASNQNAQNAALANLNARTAGIETLVLPNGSMEFDLDLDGEPDNWNITDLGSAGATHVIDTTASSDGLNSLKCSITNTGGYVEALNDTILPIYEGARIEVGFGYKSSLATARVRVNIRWLTGALPGSLVTEVSVFDSAANHPSSFEHRNGVQVSVVAPATTRWFQVKLIAGESGNTTNADVYFDSIIPRIYHGLVPVDQSLAAALITSGTGTNVSVTLPASIVGTERPWCALLDVYCEWSTGGGTNEMVFSENSSGTGQVWGRIFSDPTNIPNEGWYPQKRAPVRLTDKGFYIFEQSLTGADNMVRRRVYLAGYYV